MNKNLLLDLTSTKHKKHGYNTIIHHYKLEKFIENNKIFKQMTNKRSSNCIIYKHFTCFWHDLSKAEI